MAKRKHMYVKALSPAIYAMAEQGMTQREIAEHYGFASKLVVKKLLERSRLKERTIPKTRGRKPAKAFIGAFCAVRTNWGSLF